MRTTTIRGLAAAGTLLLVLTGCAGADDEGEVRDIGSGSEASASGSGSGSGSASGSGTASDSGSASGSGTASDSGSASGSGSGVAAAEAECDPVNPELEAEADETVEVSLVDYAFDPSSVEVGAGIVTFATSNEGDEAHEFAVLPGGGDVPLTDDGAPDEEALADAGAFELEAYGPGQDCTATWELEPGDYTLFCIVEAPDGETHAEKGMVGALTVTDG